MTVLKVDMSIFDHYLFTTNRQENNRLEEMLDKKNGNLLKAITEIAREKEKEHELSPYLL
jgi:hypothetical protein